MESVASQPTSLVARIIRDGLPEYRKTRGLSLDQLKACAAILRCRSGELGYLEGTCGCGYRQRFAASCRNRHCPACQAGAALHWVEGWQAKIPEVPTYHCVFTVPGPLRLLFEFGRRECYGALFAIARLAIEKMCRKHPRLSGVNLGMIAMLHTWGSQLQYHPHLHVLLCGAGFRADGSWVQLPWDDGWLMSVKALGRCFRKLLLQWFAGQLQAGEELVFGLPRRQVASLLRRAGLHKWRVFIQKSRCGPDRALAYLGRYAYRVGINPSRIRNYTGERVELAFRGPGEKFAARTCRLDTAEFIARFLQHVLPAGFRKIRAYGFLLRGGAPKASPLAIASRPESIPMAATVPICPHCRVPLVFTFLSAAAGSPIMRCAHAPP